ncbi:MAG: hypothetical protein ACYCO5_02355 [Acidobacteriaceae bacterium]
MTEVQTFAVGRAWKRKIFSHAAGAEAMFVATPEDAGAWLRENLRSGDAVLLKASRGVRLERALEVLDREE